MTVQQHLMVSNFHEACQSQMSINLLFSEYRVVRFDKFPNSLGASPATSFPSDMNA